MNFDGLKATVVMLSISLVGSGTTWAAYKEEKRQEKLRQLQEKFQWWPTDAQPAPVKDEKRGGYWWWPNQPGQARPWGNRGYVYVHRIIFDYKETDDEAIEKNETDLPAPVIKPALLIKKIIKNVKIYFDYNKADLRDDHIAILNNAVKTLQRNPQADILVTGNCDARGSAEYNLRLGNKRGEAVKKFLIDHGIFPDRIKIISRGKLDAAAHLDDLQGMQKDRNAQFVIAEVEELQLPSNAPEIRSSRSINANKFVAETEQRVESQTRVSTRAYTIKTGDSLWKIAQREMGNGNRWKYLYELNKDKIRDPKKLSAGKEILIPIE